MSLERIAVIGAGTMGSGIALVCIRKGYSVTLVDPNREMLNQADDYLHSMTNRDYEKGKITLSEKGKISERVTFIDNLDELGDVDVVIEAIKEDMEIKQGLFRQLSSICRSDTYLLTNTSSLSVTHLASVVDHPERVVGMHFFNPAAVMPLVEVVKGQKTGEEQAMWVYHFAIALGKEPVLVEDVPGFIVNRIARPFYNEALRIVGDRIADPQQIDQIMKEAGGFKMGPFELQDLIGIDINFAVTESLYDGFFQEGRFKPSRIQQKMVHAGSLGRKTGEGFYRHES